MILVCMLPKAVSWWAHVPVNLLAFPGTGQLESATSKSIFFPSAFL